MNGREYLRLIAVTPIGVVSVALSAAIGAAAWVASSPALGLLSGLASLAVILIAMTFSGLGPKAAAAELERRDWADSRRRLELAKADRDRLASLRLPDAEVKALLELVAARGSAYLSASYEAKAREPAAEEALSECVSIADLYLKELDGASTEKRYGLSDADPFADAKARTKAALIDKAAIIEKAALGLSGGLSSADRMEIKESL
jgi:hypothetical protein